MGSARMSLAISQPLSGATIMVFAKPAVKRVRVPSPAVKGVRLPSEVEFRVHYEYQKLDGGGGGMGYIGRMGGV